MSKLIEKREELRTKQAALATIFAAAGSDLDLSKVEELKNFTSSAAKAAEIKRLNDELTAIGQEVDGLLVVERAAENVKSLGQRMTEPAGGMSHPNGGPAQATQERKSLGQLFTEAAEYKTGLKDSKPRFAVNLSEVELKTLLETTVGWAPFSPQTGRLVPFANRRLMVADVIPTSPTTAASIRYMEETTFTNNAAPVAEGAVKPEAALAYTERIVPVEVIATWLPVTRQQLDDVPGIQSVINDRLTLMLLLTEEVQLLTGPFGRNAL